MTYLNDIIIYLNLEEEHEKHIKWVLEKLHNKNIPVTRGLLQSGQTKQNHSQE